MHSLTTDKFKPLPFLKKKICFIIRPPEPKCTAGRESGNTGSPATAVSEHSLPSNAKRNVAPPNNQQPASSSVSFRSSLAVVLSTRKYINSIDKNRHFLKKIYTLFHVTTIWFRTTLMKVAGPNHAENIII